MALMVVGALLFFSTFISSALHFGDFTDFENRTRSMAVRSLTGMGLLIVGGLIRGVGAKGLACDHLNEEDSKFCQECGAPMRA